MTAKAPTPMPEGMSRENRPKAPAAPPKLTMIVTVNINIKPEPKYPVYAFDMWMWFNSRHDYFDWLDRLRYK